MNPTFLGLLGRMPVLRSLHWLKIPSVYTLQSLIANLKLKQYLQHKLFRVLFAMYAGSNQYDLPDNYSSFLICTVPIHYPVVPTSSSAIDACSVKTVMIVVICK